LTHFLFQEFDDIPEAIGVLRIGLGERFVRLQHMGGLLRFVSTRLFFASVELLGDFFSLHRVGGAFAVHVQDMIQPQAAEQLLVTRIGVEHTYFPAAIDIPKVQRRSSERAEKGTVHDGTSFKIDDELTGAALNHRLEASLRLNAVLERPLAFNSHPEKGANTANKNGGGRGHGG